MDDLFSIIPQVERGDIHTLFAVLKRGAFDEAIARCSRIIRGDYSREAKAFGRYGAAVALMQRFVQRGQGQPGDVDIAISHYERCLDELKFGDAYLMLGMALMSKTCQLQEEGKDPLQYHHELLELAERALDMFQQAVALNPGFRRDATEEIRRLEPSISGLKARLVSCS